MSLLRGGERFRGSSEVPLAPEGIQHAQELGMQLQRRGGLDELHTSSMGRAVQTARQIQKFTHAPIVQVTDGLHPWHVGALEGQPVTQERIDYMHNLTSNEPDEVIPGRGPLSVADGESFNQFKQRTLNTLQSIIQQSASAPDRRIGVVTHYRVKKLLEAWMRRGAPQDGEIDPEVMNTHDAGAKPTSIDRLYVDPNIGLQQDAVDLHSPAQLQGGIYVIRHGKTDWNSSES